MNNATVLDFPVNPAWELVRIGQAVKRDVGKYLRYRTQGMQNEKVELLTQRCRERIFSRLEKVATLQAERNFSPDTWHTILQNALSIVHKHRESPELQEEIKKLFLSYYDDPTKTKVEFVRTYMELVARMSPEQSSAAFH